MKRLSVLSFFLLVHSGLVLGQNNNPSSPPGGVPVGGSGNTTVPAATVPVATGKYCPFNVDLTGFIDAGNLTSISSFATELKNLNKDNTGSCQMIGQNIGVLLQRIDPEKFPPPVTNNNGGPPQPPPTCITNPQGCADLLTTLMNAYKDGKCGASGDQIANSLVALAVQISSAAGPSGAAAAISAQVVMEVYNIAKEKSGAIGKANKLNKDKMEQLRNNIKGLMACMANDTYDSTICRTVELNKIASFIKNPSKQDPPANDKLRISRANLKLVYTCIQGGKNFADCIKGISTEVEMSADGKNIVAQSRPATPDDFVHDRKVLDKAAVTVDKITDGQLATFIKTAEQYHEKELKDIGLKYNDLQRNKRGDYNTNAYGGQHSLLIKHCFHNYIPAHTEEKDVHYFTNSTRQWDHMYCPRLHACLDKINKADPSKALSTLDIFTNGQKKATDETACLGIGKLEHLDETSMQDELNKVKFNPTLAGDKGCVVLAGASSSGTLETSTTND